MCSNSAVVDCAVGSAVLGKRGYNLSSTQSMVLFHVKAMEKKKKKFSELTESAAMGVFDGVCNFADCIHYSSKRISDYCIFNFLMSRADTKKAPIRHKR